MKAILGWQPAQPGVMLYLPALRVSVEDTEHSMSQLSVTDDTSLAAQSQVSNISDTVLRSCENEFGAQIKVEPAEPNDLDLSRADSLDTLAGNNDEEVSLNTVPVVPSRPESTSSQDFLSQLIAAVESGSHKAETPFAKASAYHDATLTTENFLKICYDSDRTDFQESPSPTARMSRKTVKRTTSAIDHHFKRRKRSGNKQPPVRPLNFGTRLTSQAKKPTKKSANALSLENLRNVEQAPSHNWDQEERELLCVINRWYCAKDRATELATFASIFNSITGLKVLPIRVRNQFESHLTLFGGNAYPEFGRVFSVPFDDPEDCYTEIRNLIEAEAEALNLNLQRRRFDTTIPSGRAEFAKSPRTRSIYESLVRRASHKAQVNAIQASGKEKVVLVTRSVVTTGKAIKTSLQDDWEVITDAELSPVPAINSIEEPRSISARPHLAFRVWDAENRTKFIDGSFVAQAFVDWPRPLPGPIALDDPSGAGKILTVLHLSKQGDTPVFISTAGSLLQALSYATNMQQPQIALINLDAPSLQEENKLHHAGDVFPWLKSQGLAKWARYKGHGEYFVWGDIPSHAVLHTLDLTDLIRNLNNDADCHALLSFEVFEPGTKTNMIAAALREKNTTLNTATARALGKTSQMFGMSHSNVTLEHIQDFVARVTDGWTITKADNIDVHTMSSLAATFATASGPHTGRHTLQEIMAAFMEGVNHGTRCIAHWSRSRSGSRRQRFREA